MTNREKYIVEHGEDPCIDICESTTNCMGCYFCDCEREECISIRERKQNAI